MTLASLQAIVENAKKIAGISDKGYYTVDTADKVGEMISRFLLKKDFESYVMNIENYKQWSGEPKDSTFWTKRTTKVTGAVSLLVQRHVRHFQSATSCVVSGD